MDDNARAGDPEEQAVTTRRPWEPGHGHRCEDRPDPLREPCGPAQDELGLLRGEVPGHRWDGWHRLTGDEGYFAACSCGWRGTETGSARLMLGQAKEHLDAVGAVRGWRPSTRTAQAPARAGREAGPRGMRQDERTRELYASVESQHRRLSQALEHSVDLLSASGGQADRFVAVLEHAAARVAPEWARTTAAVQSGQALQRRAERARELRNGIVAAAAGLAAIAGEALADQDPETRGLTGSAGHRGLAGEPANRHGGRGCHR